MWISVRGGWTLVTWLSRVLFLTMENCLFMSAYNARPDGNSPRFDPTSAASG